MSKKTTSTKKTGNRKPTSTKPKPSEEGKKERPSTHKAKQVIEEGDTDTNFAPLDMDKIKKSDEKRQIKVKASIPINLLREIKIVKDEPSTEVKEKGPKLKETSKEINVRPIEKGKKEEISLRYAKTPVSLHTPTSKKQGDLSYRLRMEGVARRRKERRRKK